MYEKEGFDLLEILAAGTVIASLYAYLKHVQPEDYEEIKSLFNRRQGDSKKPDD